MPLTNPRSVSVTGQMKVLTTKKTVHVHGSVLNFDLYHIFFMC